MQEVMRKLSEHDEQFVQVKKQLKQIDAHFGQVDKRFEQIDQRFERLEDRVDFIATKVSEHDGRLDSIDQKLEQMATKQDIARITDTLDHIVKLVEKRDQELTIVTHDMRNFEDRLEVAESDIKQIKPALGLV